MQTVLFFLIMAVSWCVFYILEVIVGTSEIRTYTYFICMHIYFAGYLICRRMYLLKNEDKIKNALRTKRLKKQIKKMRKENKKNGEGNTD